MKAPWFCCGWWSPWCVIDTFIHEVLRVDLNTDSRWRWICDRHDRAITEEMNQWAQ